MIRKIYSVALIAMTGVPGHTRLVSTPSSLVCPSGASLNVKTIAFDKIRFNLTPKGGNVRLQSAEQLSGDCAGLVTQSVANLYKLRSGIIIGSATGKEIQQKDLLPRPVPPVIIRQTQFGTGPEEVKVHVLFDVTHWTRTTDTERSHRYLAIGKQGTNWVVADVEKPQLKQAKLAILATSPLPLRFLGYLPFVDGPSGTIAVLQEVSANQLHKISLSWTHGAYRIDDVGGSIVR